MISFLLGCFVGAIIGALAMAVCAVASDADDYLEDVYRDDPKEDTDWIGDEEDDCDQSKEVI